MKKATDYKYFREKTMVDEKGSVFCGEYGRCAICGKRKNLTEIAFGYVNRFHLCKGKHFDLFLKTYFGEFEDVNTKTT